MNDRCNTPQNFQLDGVAFFGRTFNEYMQMFDMSKEQLYGKKVLDCPAGPASFVAEASKLGISAIGCDPLYDNNYHELAQRAHADIEECLARTAKKPHLFYRQTVDEIAAFKNEKLQAAERFAEDFAEGIKQGRYVKAALPQLPFEDKSFDITLSSNLLFLYTDQKIGGLLENSPFNYEFHLKALRELFRVTKSQLRLYPIEMPAIGMHEYVDRLTSDLQPDGIRSQIIKGSYRDIKGADHALVFQLNQS